eukprot:TRINITY_DN16133_c0_g1_i1.p1 TRINITY_DN16133_c0_g1~~TRINITY_DN16133_c0_g1_i1.p1  ORF type:complete len:838 (+),score=95.85 TRINITY_DN16133_c0_g1_i1:84-2597(+)
MGVDNQSIVMPLKEERSATTPTGGGESLGSGSSLGQLPTPSAPPLLQPGNATPQVTTLGQVHVSQPPGRGQSSTELPRFAWRARVISLEELPPDLGSHGAPPVPCRAHLTRLDVQCDIQVATAFVTLTGSLHMHHGARPGDYVLLVPMNEDSLLLSCTVGVNCDPLEPAAWARSPECGPPPSAMPYGSTLPRVVETVVVDPKHLSKQTDAEREQVRARRMRIGHDGYMPPLDHYLPHVFRCPVSGLSPGDVVHFRVEYMEAMEFAPESSGRQCSEFVFTFPLGGEEEPFSAPDWLAPGVNVGDVLCAEVALHAGTESVELITSSTGLRQQEGGSGARRFVQPRGTACGGDLRLGYKLTTAEVLCTAVLEGGEEAPDGRRSLAVLLSPAGIPGPELQLKRSAQRRSMVFLFDESCSMAGQPIEAARIALGRALGSIPHGDHFAIISFNEAIARHHSQRGPPGTSPLIEATPHTIAEAQGWVARLAPSGGTNILDPLRNAVQWLREDCAFGRPGHGHVPFVFLFTDGSVANEREIVEWAESCYADAQWDGLPGGPVRIFTFGIGQCCNQFFLRMLARKGRGHFASAIDMDQRAIMDCIVNRVQRWMAAAQFPLLTDITLHGASDWGLLPDPVPILTCGAPLVLTAKPTLKQAMHPVAVSATDMLTGDRWDRTTTPVESNIRVSRLAARARIDRLVEQAWCGMDKKMEEQAVDLSVTESIPCAKTAVVARDWTPEQYQQNSAVRRNDRKLYSSNVAGSAVAGMAIVAATLTGAAAFGLVGAELGYAGLLGGGDFYGGGLFHGGDGGGGPCDCCGCDGCDCDCSVSGRGPLSTSPHVLQRL